MMLLIGIVVLLVISFPAY
ncbi:type I toxin-antitoxin system Ibs family toxin [Escherichia coli]